MVIYAQSLLLISSLIILLIRKSESFIIFIIITIILLVILLINIIQLPWITRKNETFSLKNINLISLFSSMFNIWQSSLCYSSWKILYLVLWFYFSSFSHHYYHLHHLAILFDTHSFQVQFVCLTSSTK